MQTFCTRFAELLLSLLECYGSMGEGLPECLDERGESLPHESTIMRPFSTSISDSMTPKLLQELGQHMAGSDLELSQFYIHSLAIDFFILDLASYKVYLRGLRIVSSMEP